MAGRSTSLTLGAAASSSTLASACTGAATAYMGVHNPEQQRDLRGDQRFQFGPFKGETFITVAEATSGPKIDWVSSIRRKVPARRAR